jgi:uncharacterized protein YndB with AHSA1/START domain
MLGTVHRTGDGRLALRFERRLAHPPEQVWRAITEVEHLRHWFPVEIDSDLSPGATVRFDLTAEAKRRLHLEGADTTTDGLVTVFDPPRLLEYTWGEELTRWELSADGEGGCLLVFTDIFDGDLREPDHRNATTQASASWHACFEMLEAWLAGRPAGRSAWDRAAELAEAYLAVVTEAAPRRSR